MIIPAIGEVPNWVIASAAVAALIVIFLVRKLLRARTQRAEAYIDLIAVDIRNLFIKISDAVRSIQIDTINADTSLLAVGVVLVLVIYLVVVIW